VWCWVFGFCFLGGWVVGGFGGVVFKVCVFVVGFAYLVVTFVCGCCGGGCGFLGLLFTVLLGVCVVFCLFLMWVVWYCLWLVWVWVLWFFVLLCGFFF